MHELASNIRDNLDELADEYEQRLLGIAGYTRMPDQARREAARNAIQLIAAGLETGNQAQFVQFVQTISVERVAQGFEVDSVQRALVALVEVIEPLLTDLQEANFLWRAVVQVQAALSQMAMERVRESEERFRSVVENSPAGIFIVNEIYQFSYVNDELCRILGYTSDEMIGMDFRQVLDDEGRQIVAASYVGGQRGKEVLPRYEFNVIHKDGAKRRVEINSTVIRDAADNVRMVAQIWDITERKQIERALEEQQSFLRQVIDINPNFIYVRDREGRFVLINRAMAEVYGTTVDDLVGKTDADFNPDLGESERFLIEDRQVMDSLQEKIIPEEIVAGMAGDDRWFQTIKRPLVDGDGVARRVLGVSTDVTVRKRLELAMQASLERRGRQVQTSTEVAQEIAAATALDELYRRVVVLIKERFDYYHAQIFRYEPALGAVVLATSYGEAGKALLAEGHRLAMGRGVVGVAAAIGRPVLAADVTRDKDWVPNPHLPETKGELAVPIRLGDEVLGILDVQSKTAGALTEEDQLLLEGLCGQIAIAIESTRLRQEMQDNLRELEHLTRTMSREGWEAFRREAGQIGYLFDQTDVVPAGDFWAPEIGLAVERKALVPPTSDDLPVVVAPLLVRGEIIGALGVQDDPQSPLSEQDLALVEEVSEQVALALESARLFEQTQAALAETEALYQGGERVIRAATMEDVLRALVDSTALKLLARANLMLFDHPVLPGERPETMTVVAVWEQDDREPRVPVGASYTYDQVAGRLALFREKPTIVNDVTLDERVDGELRDLFAGQQGVRSLGSWPLVVGEQWIGVFAGQGEAPLEMSRDEVRHISSLVDQAAIVVQGMGLVAESQTRARREQALREITSIVSASQDVVAGLPAVAEHMRQLIPLDLLTLATYTPGDSEYTLFTFGVDADTERFAQSGVRLPVEGTCSGWVITHREHWLEEDIRREMLFSQDEQLVAEGITSRVLVPLLVGEQASGAIGLASAQPGAFTQEHLPLLRQVADQVALALERARLLEEARSALAEAEATHRTYLRRGWRDYLRQQELLRQGGFLYDRTEDAAVLDGLVKPVADLWRPEMEYALTKGLPATAGDGDGEKRTGLAIPIVLRGQTIGVLGVEDPAGEHRWSEDDRAVIEAVSRQLAQALENARLLGETQLRAQRERIIGDITGRVRASMDLDSILQTTVRELGVALGTDRAFIQLGVDVPPSEE